MFLDKTPKAQETKKLKLNRKKKRLKMSTRPKQKSHKEDFKWPTSYIKKCSALLITKEMQIKTKMIYHLIPVRMAIINNNREPILAMRM
jgi:hypothetical protein